MAYILKHQTSDEITSIWSTVVSNSRLDIALLSAILPNGKSPIFCETKIDNDFVQDISTRMKNSDSNNGNGEFLTDMHNSNCLGNTYERKVSVLWITTAWGIGMDTVTVDHKRRHATAYEETTNNVLCVPNVLLSQKLMDKAKDVLTKTYGKK